jgi:hypothetical protein
MCGKADDLRALKTDRSCGRAQGAGNQIEGRALAGAVGADQPENLALTDFEGDLVYRQESSEALAEPFDRQHYARMA